MDAPLVKRTEGKDKFLLIQLPKQIEGQDAFLDATRHLRKASQTDRNCGYRDENGPNFGIEVEKAREYARYVADHAHPHNIFRFNTRNYMFFIADPSQEGSKKNVRGHASKRG